MPRWTEEARQKQSDIQKQRRSWQRSTGPKTEEGKKNSSLNALKHGNKSSENLDLKKALHEQDQFLKHITLHLKLTSSRQINKLSI